MANEEMRLRDRVALLEDRATSLEKQVADLSAAIAVITAAKPMVYVQTEMPQEIMDAIAEHLKEAT